MQKFLENNLKDTQTVPLETLTTLFPKFSEISKEVQEKSNKWTMLAYGKSDDGLEWQVAFQEIFSPDNLYYHLFIFGVDGELVGHVPVQAVQQLPPVAEKIHGVDYYDWIEIQASLYKWLADHGYKVFQIDMDPEGKVVYQTQEKPEEALAKMQRGEQYTIAAIKAPIYVENLKAWKKAKLENTPTTITPEQVAKENAIATSVVKNKKIKKPKKTSKRSKKTLP